MKLGSLKDKEYNRIQAPDCLRDTQIYINNHLSMDVHGIRKELYHEVKKAKNGKTVIQLKGFS